MRAAAFFTAALELWHTPAAMLRRLPLVLGLASLGCSIDFDRYSAAAPDAAVAPPTDVVTPTDVVAPEDRPIAPVDTPPADRPIAPEDAPMPTGCPRPYVAVTVENITGSSQGGRVLRVPLNGAPPCAEARVAQPQPMAIHQIDNNDVVVGARDGVTLLDPETGRNLGTITYDTVYAGVLGIARYAPMSGVAGYVIALQSNTSSTPSTSVFYSHRGSTRLNAHSVLQSTRYVTSHPTDPTRYLAVREVSGTPVVDDVRVNLTSTTSDRWLNDSARLTTIQTVFDGRAWSAAVTSYSDGPPTSWVILPRMSDTPPVGVAYRRTVACNVPGCVRYLRATPVGEDEAVVLCDDGRDGPRKVVRTSGAAPGCVLVDGDALGAGTRISNLTLVTR